MVIHSSPKNGDYASYVRLLTHGEPGRVTRWSSHHNQDAEASNLQRLIGLFLSLMGILAIIIGGLTALVILLAGSVITAGLLPALFIVALGLVLMRLAKGLPGQAIRPQGVMPALNTISSPAPQP
jgi:hypothetical protein